MRRSIETGLVVVIAAWAVWMWVSRRSEQEAAAQAAERAAAERSADPGWVVDAPMAMLAVAETGFVGRVTAATGAELVGVEVCALPAELRFGIGTPADFVPGIRCVPAGEDGGYRLVGLAPGAYRVAAGASGWLPLQVPEAPAPGLRLQRGELREGLDFSLGQRGEAVHGVVRDVLGGTIAGALVATEMGSHALSDEDGLFTLWAAAEANTLVGVAAPGYTGEWAFARPPQSVMVFTLTPESVLRGQVVRAEGGGPLVGLAVLLDGERVAAVSGEDGSFEVRGLEAGGRRPFVRSEGWCGEAERVTALGPGETSEVVTIAAQRCPLVRAEVRVKGTDAGCEAARVELLDAAGDVRRRALGDALGQVELSGVEPGAYSVRVQCPGFLQRAPEPWLLGEAMETRVRWEVEPGRTVRGQVVDANGVAVPRANVEVVWPGGYTGAYADVAGNFVVTGVGSGASTLRPYHAQYSEGEALALTIAEDRDPAPVRLKFAPCAAIRGTVVARDGQLPANLTVVARALENLGAKSVKVGEDGRFALSGLSRGPYRVAVQRVGGVVAIEDAGELTPAVEVELGGRDEVIGFAVPGAQLVALSGRVEDPEGAGEVDAVVTVGDRRTHERALTDEAGRFAVMVEAGERYRVAVTSRAGARVEAQDVAPGSELVLKIAATRRVCGEVTAEDGVTGRYALRIDGAEVGSFAAARWCVDDVAVGEHRLTAESQSLGVAAAKLTVAKEGEATAPTLVFAGRGTLRGRVLDSERAPRAGVTVWAFDAAGRIVGGNHVSDAAGEFTVAGASGELTVVALPLGPLPGRDELLARGVKVTVKAGKTAKVVVAAP